MAKPSERDEREHDDASERGAEGLQDRADMLGRRPWRGSPARKEENFEMKPAGSKSCAAVAPHRMQPLRRRVATTRQAALRKLFLSALTGCAAEGTLLCSPIMRAHFLSHCVVTRALRLRTSCQR